MGTLSFLLSLLADHPLSVLLALRRAAPTTPMASPPLPRAHVAVASMSFHSRMDEEPGEARFWGSVRAAQKMLRLPCGFGSGAGLLISVWQSFGRSRSRSRSRSPTKRPLTACGWQWPATKQPHFFYRPWFFFLTLSIQRLGSDEQGVCVRCKSMSGRHLFLTFFSAWFFLLPPWP